YSPLGPAHRGLAMVADTSERILIADGEAAAAAAARQRLERAGYRVTVAGTAADALRLIRDEPFDLILLDYRVPGAPSGLEFLGRLREAGCDLPVILVADTGTEAVAVAALRAGVRDFLTRRAADLDYLPGAVGRVLKQVATERRRAESEAQLASVIAAR